MPVGKGGNLRKVCYDEDLGSRREGGEAATDLDRLSLPRLGDLLLGHRDGDDGMWHGERTQFRGDRRAESVRPGTSGRGHLDGEPGQLRAYLCSLRAKGVDPLVVALE